MRYTKHSTLTEKGVPTREEPEVVDDQHVQRFISPDTLAFFRNLGGTEVVTLHPDGTIIVKSTSPDGDKVRLTVFEPLKEET